MSTYDQLLPGQSADELTTEGISSGETIGMALDNLRANAFRSLLTALGVIIGVAAVVALLALGRGAQQRIAEQITANGANLLTVHAGSLSAGGFSSSGSETRSLTSADARALADPANAPDLLLVSPETTNFGSLVVGSQNTMGMVVGATPTYLPIHNGLLAEGDFFNESQVTSVANVAVLGQRLATTLFGQESPVGRSMRIDGQPFRVIGVLRAKGGGFNSIDDGLVIPITTSQRRLFGARDPLSGQDSVSQIAVQARDEHSIGRASAQVTATLRERHRLKADDQDDFTINNQQDLIDTLTQSQRSLTLYLGAIAAISLVVGGIGIMNIMLVSVRERTREIGLRKALGARERDILAQFLIEALALSLGGALLGLLCGVLISASAEQLGQARAVLTIEAMLLPVGFAVLIGLFFGIEPARRAALLDPVEALRYE